MAKQEGRASVKRHHKVRPDTGLTHRCKRASKCPLSWGGCIVRVTDGLGPAAGGTCQDTEIMRPNEGYSPLKTTEEGAHRDTGRQRPCKGR